MSAAGVVFRRVNGHIVPIKNIGLAGARQSRQRRSQTADSDAAHGTGPRKPKPPASTSQMVGRGFAVGGALLALGANKALGNEITYARSIMRFRSEVRGGIKKLVSTGPIGVPSARNNQLKHLEGALPVARKSFANASGKIRKFRLGLNVGIGTGLLGLAMDTIGRRKNRE